MGGGRGERHVEDAARRGAPDSAGARAGSKPDAAVDARDGPLFGPPGQALAGAVAAAADPVLGTWPVGTLPGEASTEPLRQVIHAVVASRRLAGWALWAQLSMIGRLLTAWQVAPPVSNTT